MLAFLQKILALKVGSGPAFLLYMALVIVYGLISKGSFSEVAPWLGAGMGFHSGQRAVTAIKLSKNGNTTEVEQK